MFRSVGAALIVTMLFSATPVFAADGSRTAEPMAPSKAVAAAWAKESGQSSKTLRSLFAAYGATQALDVATTVMARNRGAVEANPLMSGGYGKGFAVKATMAAVSIVVARAMAKKNKKAAIITMIAMNALTASVAMNNMRNAQHLR